LRSTDGREVPAKAHDVVSRCVEVEFADEHDATLGYVGPQRDLDTHDRYLASVDPHRDDRITAGIAIVALAIVGERVDRVHRVALAAPARRRRGVAPEEQRKTIAVQRW